MLLVLLFSYAVPSRKRRKRLLEQAKGFYGNSSRNLRNAYDAVERAQRHAYVGRKQKKQQYRALWIVRINAACRALDVNYSRFMAYIPSFLRIPFLDPALAQTVNKQYSKQG